MSDTSGEPEAAKVSLTKKLMTGPPKGPFVPRAEWPRSLRIAVPAIGALVIFAVLRALLAFLDTSQLETSLIKSDAKLKPPKVPCTSTVVKNCVDIRSVTHTGQVEGVMFAVILSIFVVICARGVLRRRRNSRMFIAVISILGGLILGYAGSPLALATVISGDPALLTVVGVIAGLASVVALFTLYRPDMRAYFNPSGEPQRPSGLASLFGPKSARGPRPGSAAARAAANAEAETAPAAETESATPARSRAKVRSDADAVAKGAELARSRAKASKSRRSDI